MYLDADTLPVKPLDGLFDTARDGYFVPTQFNDWVTNGGMILKRITRLEGRLPDAPALGTFVHDDTLKNAQSLPISSPNGGVFAFSSHDNSRLVLDEWESLTAGNLDLFIADETVLQVVHAAHAGYRSVCMPGLWNSSPKFYKDKDKVRIWHFHGDSNVRPSKSQFGFDLWWPEWEKVKAGNIGGANEWYPDCGNKFIKGLESDG